MNSEDGWTPTKLPDGCVCDPRSWARTPAPACAEYVPGPFYDCDYCNHEHACHTGLNHAYPVDTL